MEQEPELTQQGGLRGLLIKSLTAAALVFAWLEIWRPLYFSTDDNFDGGVPFLTGMGRNLMQGKSPFYTEYLFGGGYDLLRDCTFFAWHPIYLLVSLLAETPARFMMVDAVAFFYLMLAAAGFTNLAWFLRRELSLNLSDGRLIFYTLSFTYSMIVLATGSSWLNFLGSHSALPWLALGVMQKSWRRGIGFITLFSLHGILGGHLVATISNSIFLGLFAFGVAWYRRSFAPLWYLITGTALAVMLLSPLLVPALQGFFDADRSEGVTTAVMGKFAMPTILMPFSYFLGTLSVFLPTDFGFGFTPLYYSSAFVSCAAAWAIIPALRSRAPWHRLEIICLGLVAVAAFLVIRPHWMNEIMVHLPLIKSMRWPFREILQLQFFLHLFLVLRPPGGSVFFQRWIAIPGVFIFLFPLFVLPAPTFHPMRVDRELIYSGRAERYWEQVKPLIGPDECIVPVVDAGLMENKPFDIPFSLIGAYDYPIFFKVRSATGYSVAAPRDQFYLHVPPPWKSGIFTPSQKAAILQERPNVRFITLESVEPLRITLSSKDGPPIDLTPFIPAK